MSQKVRVRFAPSPTGPLHIGGVRTALFNYLFAKKHGGDFILRIEDTDQNRYVEGAEAYIVEALNWCGIPFDEGPGASSKDGDFGPYRQSERKHLYKAYAMELIEKGHAYYAFDTAEQLDFHRKDHEAKGKTFIYNWHNRLKLSNSLSLNPEEVKRKLDAGEDYVIRFKSPQDQELLLHDIIRGEIKIDTNILDDKVLFKSDGMPTYHLANIVDDHLMEISHVIRGEEWLPSLALHQLLYNAFGWKSPEFAHLPLIMKPVGKGKLSKRDGEKGGFPVFPLSWNESEGYREAGFFPEAVVNFLALLGWNPGTEQELFSLEELVEVFTLERVNKSGARFDPDKTKWYNHQYLQQKNDGELASLFGSMLNSKELPREAQSAEYLEKVVSLIKERANFVADFWELGSYFFEAPASYNEKAVKKQWKEGTPELMQHVLDIVKTTEDFNSATVETNVKSWITDNELSFGKVMGPLRLIIVGDMKGPHIFDILALLGKEESVARIEKALEVLS
ncbi:glutamate--tRNA ligase [Flagellimonas sp. HMM57]|uniref:glutamate--tRNA ligase n=1 Tax=unclassified Flagellimonas TaxID=2644544 RepID=UPI0013D0E2F2|nr:MULTISPECIES: glutamate--tRNA ligase [unclassified Flagellimonas]UII77627.1 glutamate--tRNA ligase [Flagellimonas sp. HMM57]